MTPSAANRIERMAGHGHGKTWARRYAGFRRLQRLHEFAAKFQPHGLDGVIVTQDGIPAAEVLSAAIYGPDSGSRSILSELHLTSVPDAWLLGFAEGALEIWTGMQRALERR